MILLICGIISIALFISTVIASILLRKDLRNAIRALSVGFFATIFVALAPCHVVNGKYSFGVNLFDTICVMITQSSLSNSLDIISQIPSSVAEVYRIYVICLYVLGPLSVAGATLSFIRGFGKIVYALKSLANDSYIFTFVNERSLAVCKSVRQKYPKAVILFALDNGKDGIDENAMSQIEELGCIVIRQNVREVKHNLAHKRHYYLLHNDPSVNIEQGLAVNGKYKGKKTAEGTVELLIYSTDEMSQIIFYNTPHHVKIRLFREEEIIANDLLFNYPLYGGVSNGKLNVLLIGGGKVGYEILKKIIWAGRLGERVKTQINVVDANAEAVKLRLKKECPALFYNCKIDLNFFDADVFNDKFTSVLKSITPPTYVVAALSDEKANAEACIYLRRFFGVNDGFPKLHMVTDTEDYVKKLELLSVYDWTTNADRSFSKRDDTEQNFQIKGFGSYESAYRLLEPEESAFGMMALACHVVKLNMNLENRNYKRPDESAREFIDSVSYSYNQVAFCKNNADQLALSVSYILYALGYAEKHADYLKKFCKERNASSVYDLPLALYVDPDYDFDGDLQANIKEITALVTERFNLYMYTLGWTNLPVEEIKNKSTRDQLRLKYARIGDYDVEALERLVNDGESKITDYRQNDIDEVLRLPLVLKIYDEITKDNSH